MSFEKVDLASRKWIITINWSVFGNRYTHDEIKKILSDLHLNYWCMSDEWCRQNYYTVLFIYRLCPIRKSVLFRLFPVVPCVPVTGSCKFNRMFVWKEGIMKEKFPRVISFHKTREQWHPKGTNLQCILHNTGR